VAKLPKQDVTLSPVILLRSHNEYDQFGGYFAGIYESEAMALEAIGGVGFTQFGRSKWEYTWYDVIPLDMNSVDYLE
jgi:hypothetical protein